MDAPVSASKAFDPVAHAAAPLLRPLAPGEPRSEAQVREHYVIERELAERLRRAPKAERQKLYSQVYNELLARVPHHPRLRARRDAGAARARQERATYLLGFLRRFLASEGILMEIGGGDCATAMRACAEARLVYEVEVARQIPPGVTPPENFELVLIDGYTIPLPAESADVAFSDQLMEHLHPEDAEDQLREIHRCLRPNGVYLCITPNRLYGPRDISVYFDEMATGMHLREYSAREIRAIFMRAGFQQVRFYIGSRSRTLPCPYLLLAAAETVLDALPHPLRRRLADTRAGRALLELRVAGFKAP